MNQMKQAGYKSERASYLRAGDELYMCSPARIAMRLNIWFNDCTDRLWLHAVVRVYTIKALGALTLCAESSECNLRVNYDYLC